MSSKTPGERAVWVAVYAQAWQHPFTPEYGHLGDGKRARLAVAEAQSAVRALRRFAENAVPMDDASLQAAAREAIR